MSLGAAICWGAWIAIISNLDPSQAGIAGFIFFYSTLFFALTGTLSVAGFLIRKLFVGANDPFVYRHVRTTFRQGIFISFAILIFLLLQQLRVLTWWNTLILLVIAATAWRIICSNKNTPI